jgi:hypothetical protein
VVKSNAMLSISLSSSSSGSTTIVTAAPNTSMVDGVLG